MTDDTSKSNLNRGRWSEEERNLFNLAYHWYGKDWKKLQELIPSRTPVQIRSHAQKIDKKNMKKEEAEGQSQKVFILQSAVEDLNNYISSTSSKSLKRYMEYQNELVYAQLNTVGKIYKNSELSLKGELHSS